MGVRQVLMAASISSELVWPQQVNYQVKIKPAGPDQFHAQNQLLKLV